MIINKKEKLIYNTTAQHDKVPPSLIPSGIFCAGINVSF